MFARRKRGRVVVVHNVRIEGKVVQQEVASFASPAELEAALASDRFARWRGSVERSHPAITCDWKGVEASMRRALKGWTDTSIGRLGRILRLAVPLESDLAALSPAAPDDAVQIDAVRPLLLRLALQLERVLGRGLSDRPVPVSHGELDDLFDEALERWWQGDRAAAVALFREVLARDPQHADAHNHLGIHAFDRDRMKDAERHFRAAIEGGARELEAADGFLSWAEVQNRPYLRAHANLALVFRRQERWADALAIHQQMLRWNPTDNQGARFLVGEEHHRLGDLQKALAAYERSDDSDPGTAYGKALVLLELGRENDADRAMLRAFASNCYVPPILLCWPWERLPGRHLTSDAEPERAAEYVESCGELWDRHPTSVERLADRWTQPHVHRWRADLDDLMVALERAEPASRGALLDRWEDRTSSRSLDRLLADLPVAYAAEEIERLPFVEPLPIGDTLVTDLRHYLAAADPGSDIPGPARRIGLYQGRIAEAASAWAADHVIDTAIRCRRRPRHRACPGHVRARLKDGAIAWACSRCRDNGHLSGWQGTPWDLTPAGPVRKLLPILVPLEWYDRVRALPLGDARRPVARAMHHPPGADLMGSEGEYEALAAALAASDPEAAELVLARRS